MLVGQRARVWRHKYSRNWKHRRLVHRHHHVCRRCRLKAGVRASLADGLVCRWFVGDVTSLPVDRCAGAVADAVCEFWTWHALAVVARGQLKYVDRTCGCRGGTAAVRREWPLVCGVVRSRRRRRRLRGGAEFAAVGIPRRSAAAERHQAPLKPRRDARRQRVVRRTSPHVPVEVGVDVRRVGVRTAWVDVGGRARPMTQRWATPELAELRRPWRHSTWVNHYRCQRTVVMLA